MAAKRLFVTSCGRRASALLASCDGPFRRWSAGVLGVARTVGRVGSGARLHVLAEVGVLRWWLAAVAVARPLFSQQGDFGKKKEAHVAR